MASFEEWSKNIQTLNPSQPTPSDTSWDKVFLGGDIVPGVAKVSVRKKSGLDIQKPKGGKRASIVDNGDPLAKVTIRLEMFADEYKEFRDFILPIIAPKNKSGGREPLEIGHPHAQMYGINTVAIEDIDAPAPESGSTVKVTITAVEWAPAPAKVKTTGKVKSGEGSKTVATRTGTTTVLDVNEPLPPEFADGFTDVDVDGQAYTVPANKVQ